MYVSGLRHFIVLLILMSNSVLFVEYCVNGGVAVALYGAYAADVNLDSSALKLKRCWG